MNKNSNTYIIVYSAVLVVVVAVLLGWAAMSLKAPQQENVRIEKMTAILTSVGQAKDVAEARNKAAYITQEYEKYITGSFCVDGRGDQVDSVDAFAQLDDLKGEYAKPAAERILPVFVNEQDGAVRYIFPVWGAGLWGPIWGYVALEEDLDAIYGVSFDHKGETPGLGAEISTQEFARRFNGKRLFENGQFVSVVVLKGAGASTGNPHAIDAVSGGTITSRGVEAMLRKCMEDYMPFIEKMRASRIYTDPPVLEMASDHD